MMNLASASNVWDVSLAGCHFVEWRGVSSKPGAARLDGGCRFVERARLCQLDECSSIVGIQR